MPAKPKTKRTAKAKTRDNGLWRKWENDPAIDPEGRNYMRDFYYRRRHLATAIDPNWDRRRRSPKYEIELNEMDAATCEGLELIYKRDGAEIFKEASRSLLIEVLRSIEYVGSSLPKPWRSMLKVLVAERQEEEARNDARVGRRVRPEIAASQSV
jgi:hypothetical protein